MKMEHIPYTLHLRIVNARTGLRAPITKVLNCVRLVFNHGTGSTCHNIVIFLPGRNCIITGLNSSVGCFFWRVITMAH